MIELAYQVFDKSGRIVTKRKTFRTAEAMEKFIEKIDEKGDLYQVYGTREI